MKLFLEEIGTLRQLGVNMEEPRYLLVFNEFNLKTYSEIVEYLQSMVYNQRWKLNETLDSPIVLTECIKKILSTVTIFTVDDGDALDYSNFMSDINLEKLRTDIVADEESFKKLKEAVEWAEYQRLKEKYERT